MRGARAHLGAIVAVALLSSCGSKPTGTYVVLTISPGPNTPAVVDELILDMELNDKPGQIVERRLTEPSKNSISLPTTVTIDVVTGEGELNVTVWARNNAGHFLDAGFRQVTILRNKTVNLDLTFNCPSASAQHPLTCAGANQLSYCPDVRDCFYNCPDQACADACIYKGTASANTYFAALYNCLEGACPRGVAPCDGTDPMGCGKCRTDAANIGGCMSEQTECNKN